MGQPHLVQLTGSHLWPDAEDLARGMTARDVRRAVAGDTSSSASMPTTGAPVRASRRPGLRLRAPGRRVGPVRGRVGVQCSFVESDRKRWVVQDRLNSS